MSRAIPERTRRIGEIYQTRIDAGDLQRDVIADLAAQFDVLPPAIRKSLQTCGVLPPYAPWSAGRPGRPRGGGEPGYTAKRTRIAQSASERRDVVLVSSRPATFEPCARCGTRSDIGCAHQPAAGPKPLPTESAEHRL